MGNTVKNYIEPIIDYGWCERVGGHYAVVVGGANDVANEILDRLADCLTNLSERLEAEFHDFQDKFIEDPLLAMVSVFVPTWDGTARDFPQFAINTAIYFGMAALAQKFGKLKAFKVISVIFDILTGGPLKTILKNLFQPFQQALVDMVTQFFSNMSARWTHFKQFKWPKIKAALKALAKGLLKGVRGALSFAIKKLKLKVMAKFLLKVAAITVKLIASIVGAPAGLAILAVVTALIYASKRSRPPAFAQGGFPNQGQMFIAREAGPELVGTIGNRNAVVNNDQIVESVSRGVYDAFTSALYSTDSDVSVLARLYLDGEVIATHSNRRLALVGI